MIIEILKTKKKLQTKKEVDNIKYFSLWELASIAREKEKKKKERLPKEQPN